MAGWSLLGKFDREARPSGVTLVLAVLFAAETFLTPDASYPLYMSLLAIFSSIYLLVRGIRAKALVGLVFAVLPLPWLNPLLGGDWFNSLSWQFFTAHALLAMAFATAGYSYMRLEGTKKKKRGSS